MNRSGNIWYPFSQQQLSPPPIHLKSGKGALLFDEAGNTYIDAISSWWTSIHGHSHPYLADAAKKQFDTLEHVIFAGFTHTPAERLAARLLGYLPHLSKVFFSDNGSTSVEVAIKMALQYWFNNGKPKRKVVAIEGAYHGDTFGAMSVSERDAFTTPFHEFFFDVTYIPFPGGDGEESIIALKEACKEKDVAAFIFEPLVQGAAGMQMYNAEVLDQLIAIAKRHEVLCIADEVMTGFYRTGSMFATDKVSNKPDIMCLSKGITGGTMPLSVTICTQEIYDAFYSSDKMKAFWHGHSYTGHPLACAVANASLDLLETETCKQTIQEIINAQEAFIVELKKISSVANIRQTGTILAWDIKVADAGYFSEIRDRLYDMAIEQGVLLRPLGNAIYILPPYCISREELSKAQQAGAAISRFVNTENT